MRLRHTIKTVLQQAYDYDADAITHRWIVQSHATYAARIHQEGIVTFTCIDNDEELVINLKQEEQYPWGADVTVMDWMDEQHAMLARA